MKVFSPESSIGRAAATMWPYVRPERNRLLVVTGLTLALTAVEVSVPLLVGVFVDSLLSDGGMDSGRLGVREVLALLLVGAGLRGYLIYRQRALSGKVGQKVAGRMRAALWTHLQKLPLDYTRRRGPGRLLVRFISDTRAVQRLVSEAVVRLAQDLMVAVGVLVALSFVNWRMGLAFALVLPAYAVIFRLLNPRLRKASRNTRSRRSRLSAHMNGRLSNLAVVKSHGHRDDEKKRFGKINAKLTSRGSRLAAAGGKLQGASAAAVSVAAALVLALAAVEISAGRLTGGQFVAFYALIGLLTPVFQRVTVANKTFQEALISIQRLSETLSEPPENGPDKDLPDLEVTEGRLSVENLSFVYPDDTQALNDVTLTARRGELVALAGPSGAGKSTLLELLPRLRNPTEGLILLDGQDLSGVSLGSLRRAVGLVTQDAPLLDGTIFENVSYGVAEGDPEADEKVRRAACLAGVEEFVEALPEGWDTILQEGRRTLSRGQRQRVALARVLASDPEVVALDEVDSSTDPFSQQQFADLLRELSREKTVIVTTHNLSTLLAADKLYRLDLGRATEEDPAVLLAGFGQGRP